MERLQAGLGDARAASGGFSAAGSHTHGAQAAGAQAGALARAVADDCGEGAVDGVDGVDAVSGDDAVVELVDAPGGVAHALSVRVTARIVIRKSTVNGASMFEGGIWIFYVEMLVVLALGGFIVWWTMPRKKAQKPEQTRTSQQAQATKSTQATQNSQATPEPQQADRADAAAPRDPAAKPQAERGTP